MDQRLELQPTHTAWRRCFPTGESSIDLDAEPDALIREWLEILDETAGAGSLT